nr:MAG TPA: hypothetical protein [Bacteriophage sp.]
MTVISFSSECFTRQIEYNVLKYKKISSKNH